MAAQFGCCECSSRTAVMIIAVLSAVHSMLGATAVIVVGGDNADSWYQTEPHFHVLMGTQFVMIVISILLWIGAYYNKWFFCVPWLSLTLLSLILLILKVILNFHMIHTEMLVFFIISCIAMMYMDWIVGNYVYALIKNGRSSNDEEQQRLINYNK